MPSFPARTRWEETAQMRMEMMDDFFKPEFTEEVDVDPVNHPAHYKAYPVEVIDIIRHVLGDEGFRAYCIGNELKYRLRAGDKGDAAQDIAKAMKYREFREDQCGQ
jgi:hypothetical protein